MIGCVCLIALVFTLLIVEPNSPKPSAGIDTTPVANSPVVTYTFEQQQTALKSWMTDFEVKTKAVNEQWQNLGEALKDTEQADIYEKMDAILEKLEALEGTYSSLEIPKELSLEEQNRLGKVAHNMDESVSSRVKYIRLTEGYLLRQKSNLYRQGQQQKELVDVYQTNASMEIEKFVEKYKIE